MPGKIGSLHVQKQAALQLPAANHVVMTVVHVYARVCCNNSSAVHLLVQSQSSKVQESEEYQQAKQIASEAEAVLA